MDLDDALRLLGLDRRASWDEVRAAHRGRIRHAHPDAGGSAAAAAAVNQAMDVIGRATAGGTKPIPEPRHPVAAPPSTSPRSVVGLSTKERARLLFRLADAAHDIGEVVFVDADAGLLEVIVGTEPGVGQLAVSMEDDLGADALRHDGLPVAFTLEPLGRAAPPPIQDVVDALMLAADLRASPSAGFAADDPSSPAG